MNAPSLLEIARAALGRDSQQKAIAVLSAYFDDSGTHGTSRVTALGGLLGTEEQWATFEKEWKSVLKEFSLSYFSSYKCARGRGEFTDRNLAERDHIRYRFRQEILKAGLVTIAACADNAAWQELVVGDTKAHLGTSEQWCFQKCLDLTMNTVRFIKPGQPVGIFLDQGMRRDLFEYANWCVQDDVKYPEASGTFPLKVADTPALQGADLIAYETYIFGQAWLDDREDPKASAHFADFRRRELTTGIILPREGVEEIVARVASFLSLSIPMPPRD